MSSAPPSTRPPARGRMIRHAPWTLLVAVAALQVFLAGTTDLSPWKGGGFGMFAATDGGPHRRIRAFVYGTAGAAEVTIPMALEDESDRVKELPTPARLDRFAERLAEATDARIGQVVRVRLVVLRTRFADGGRRATEGVLREQTTELAP